MIILHYIFLRILQSTTCSQVCTNSFPLSLYTLYLICNFLSSYQVLPFYLFLPKYIHNAHLLILSSCPLYISSFLFSLFLSLSLCIFFSGFGALFCVLCSLPLVPMLTPDKTLSICSGMKVSRQPQQPLEQFLEWHFFIQQNWICISSFHFLKR